MLVVRILTPPAVNRRSVGGHKIDDAVRMVVNEVLRFFLGQVLDHIRPETLKRLNIIKGREVMNLAVGNVQIQEFGTVGESGDIGEGI